MTSVTSALMSTVGAAGDDQSKTKNKNELSPDDFIKLFLAQLKHQNPMNPTDSSAILQQMAEISTISASKDMQQTMSDLEKKVEYMMGSTQMLQASTLINHQVEVESKAAILDEKNGMQGAAFVKDAVSDVTVTIKDKDGNTVKTIHCGPTTSGGLVDFHWDGKDESGKVCDPGEYKISAKATVDGKDVDAPTAAAFTINSVAMDSEGGVILNTDKMGGIYMKDILKIL